MLSNFQMHENVWMSRDKCKRVRVLYLQCMNPAVAFTPITRAARSVILASGTLTPITTFQSELGVQFPHKLRASHIIPKEQVYVRCISRGPSGKSLVANYKNVNSWTFQVTTRMVHYFSLYSLVLLRHYIGMY